MKRRTFTCNALRGGLGLAALSAAACRQPGDSDTFKSGAVTQEFWALDLSIQELADRHIVGPVLEQIRRRQLPADADLAFVLLNNESGGVLGYLPNRGDSIYDFAQIARNSGSIVKPLHYAIALESGAVAPNEKFFDARLSYKCDSCRGGYYSPRNYGDRYRNAAVDLTTGLAHSINSVAMQVFQRIDPATMGQKLGLLGLPAYTNPHTAPLGWEIPPLALCASFTALSGDTGSVVGPRFVLEKRVNGSSVQVALQVSERVFRSEVTVFIRNALRTCLTSGTGTAAKDLSDRLVGKTGSSSDSWGVLFGRRVTALLWVGRQGSTHEIGRTGGKLSLPLLADFMRALKTARADLLPRME
jgi:membrane peptidoglycan carboxypeptidase